MIIYRYKRTRWYIISKHIKSDVSEWDIHLIQNIWIRDNFLGKDSTNTDMCQNQTHNLGVCSTILKTRSDDKPSKLNYYLLWLTLWQYLKFLIVQNNWKWCVKSAVNHLIAQFIFEYKVDMAVFGHLTHN